MQAVRDESAKLIGELNETSSNAEQVLREVRDAAAEQGVTQQAKYFSEEATKHETLAQKWLVTAVISSLSVVAYAISTLFFPFFQLFQGDTVAQAVQLTASKVLVFVVLSALSLQTIKNYAAHRHNAVVNRHRQNALMTYTTLADAGNSPEARDTVLSHAAAAIYSPVDSGYLKSEERGYSAAPSIGLGPRNTIGAGTGGDAA